MTPGDDQEGDRDGTAGWTDRDHHRRGAGPRRAPRAACELAPTRAPQRFVCVHTLRHNSARHAVQPLAALGVTAPKCMCVRTPTTSSLRAYRGTHHSHERARWHYHGPCAMIQPWRGHTRVAHSSWCGRVRGRVAGRGVPRVVVRVAAMRGGVPRPSLAVACGWRHEP